MPSAVDRQSTRPTFGFAAGWLPWANTTASSEPRWVLARRFERRAAHGQLFSRQPLVASGPRLARDALSTVPGAGSLSWSDRRCPDRSHPVPGRSGAAWQWEGPGASLLKQLRLFPLRPEGSAVRCDCRQLRVPLITHENACWSKKRWRCRGAIGPAFFFMSFRLPPVPQGCRPCWRPCPPANMWRWTSTAAKEGIPERSLAASCSRPHAESGSRCGMLGWGQFCRDLRPPLLEKASRPDQVFYPGKALGNFEPQAQGR